MRRTLEKAWRDWSIVSLRSLALYRVALGGVSAYAILRRWPMWRLFYSEEGVYPLAALAEAAAPRFHGPFAWFQGPVATHVVFACLLLVALAFTLGIAMRVTRWLLLPALLTLHLRVPPLMTGAEAVIHAQALYAAFLPWDALRGARWLGLARPPEGAPEPVVHTAVYPLVLLQLAIIYFVTAVTKDGEAWRSGMAVYRSLASPTLTASAGGELASALPLPALEALNYATLLIEGSLPLLLLSPFRRNTAHALAAALMLALHVPIGLLMEVGIFSGVMLMHLPLLWHPEHAAETRAVPRPRPLRAVELACVALLLYVAVARLGRDTFSMPDLPKLPLPAVVETGSAGLALSQIWLMFAPDPAPTDRVLVTEAHTRGGRVFDPWRALSQGDPEPLRALPFSSVDSRLFASHEFPLSAGARAPVAAHHARWILRQGLEREGAIDPVERFDVWQMIVSTASREHVLPDDELDAALGVTRLPTSDALPIHGASSRGVWEPQRAYDGWIAPDGSHPHSPLAAPMSAGCPWLTLDLGAPREIRTIFVQADAVDAFVIEGSIDGETFEPLAEVSRVEGRGLRSRLVSAEAEGAWRYARIRPAFSRERRFRLTELALFEGEVSFDVPEREAASQFHYSRERPIVVGAFSASLAAEPSCAAERFAEPFAEPFTEPFTEPSSRPLEPARPSADGDPSG